DTVLAIDLASEAGTQVGDAPLQAPCALRHGGVIRLGRSRLTVYFGAAPAIVPVVTAHPGLPRSEAFTPRPPPPPPRPRMPPAPPRPADAGRAGAGHGPRADAPDAPGPPRGGPPGRGQRLEAPARAPARGARAHREAPGAAGGAGLGRPAARRRASVRQRAAHGRGRCRGSHLPGLPSRAGESLRAGAGGGPPALRHGPRGRGVDGLRREPSGRHRRDPRRGPAEARCGELGGAAPAAARVGPGAIRPSLAPAP